MKELIEVLNQTSAARVIFYSCVFVFVVLIVVGGVEGIVKAIIKRRNK